MFLLNTKSNPPKHFPIYIQYYTVVLHYCLFSIFYVNKNLVHFFQIKNRVLQYQCLQILYIQTLTACVQGSRALEPFQIFNVSSEIYSVPCYFSNSLLLCPGPQRYMGGPLAKVDRGALVNNNASIVWYEEKKRKGYYHQGGSDTWGYWGGPCAKV